jgi:hypothetical protein
METIRAFDSLALTAIQTQLDTPTDYKILVRIEGVRGSNPLSCTEFLLVTLPGRTVKTVEANRDSLRPLLRTSFVSMTSYQGVRVEEIAGLVGHASSRTTEVIYRRELRPMGRGTDGALVMDDR